MRLFRYPLLFVIIIFKLQQMHMQQEESEPQQQANQQQEEEMPEYAEVEGEQMKLGGLDYNLLLKQQSKQNKQGYLSNIKTKLLDYTKKYKEHEIKVKKQTSQYKSVENDVLTKKILTSSNKKNKIDQSTYFVFDMRMEFGSILPQIVSKRFGRMYQAPQYLNHSQKQITKFKDFIQQDDIYRQIEEKQHLANKIQTRQLAIHAYEDNQDSDDIFSKEQNSQMEQQKDNKKIDIEIGRKLDFGIQQQDIFNQNNYNQYVQRIKGQQAVPKIVDKYDFMKKKVKVNEVIDDGYGQCYAQTGPSLEQMKNLKKEGIQLFGDQREFTKKQRKYNVHKDYEKVKRIIDQKSKKT